MGYNTSITICNDMLDQIRSHPDDFVEGITHYLNDGGGFGVGNYANGVTVHSANHADDTQLIAVGGNYSTKVFRGWGPHHTEEGQIFLLKQWADSLGYRLVKK